MKLGINILFLEPGKVGGTEPATCKILEEIDKNFGVINKVVVYSSQTFADKYKFKNIQVKPIIKNSSNKLKRILYEIFILPANLYLDKVELLHSMGYTSPLVTHCSKVVTIHDLQFKYYPKTVSFTVRLAYLILLPLVILTNKAIITPSQSAKKQLEKEYPKIIKNKKIQAIHHGPGWTKVSNNKRIKKENYIFTPAASHPHKNLIRLIKAFALLKQDPRFSSTEIHICGSLGKQQKEIEQFIKGSPFKRNIKFLGWLSNEEYVKELSEAKVCVIPSLYEGFGIPVLESFAARTPLVTSDQTSLPEVAGDAAVYCDPFNVEDISEKVKKVLVDNKLRQQLIIKGSKRLKKFSWEKTGKKIISVYNKVLLS